MFSTSKDVQYIGGCSVHRGVSLVYQRVFSTLGDTMSISGGYYEYIGDDIMMHVEEQGDKVFQIILKTRCTEHPPIYS